MDSKLHVLRMVLVFERDRSCHGLVEGKAGQLVQVAGCLVLDGNRSRQELLGSVEERCNVHVPTCSTSAAARLLTERPRRLLVGALRGWADVRGRVECATA